MAALLASRHVAHTLRVAIDGPDAAGKTSLADELAGAVRALGRPVVRVSVDGFHRPAEERYRRGSLSADGYFLDAFDYDAVRDLVLHPLGPHGDGRYRAALFDRRMPAAGPAPVRQAPPDAVLLLDGVFLLREELRDCWELGIVVDVSPEESLRRALTRDVALFGSEAAVRERYLRRYLPGQELYRAAARPLDIADVVIDNGNPARPAVLRWPGPA
ncbi:MAG TPA: uridine kinase [Candidatus Dormibacteraeota bacterium]